MGDSTSDVKPVHKLTSKYLTPCRTFGLKRKVTPKSDAEKKIKSENDSSIIGVKAVVESPLCRKVNPRSCLTPLNCTDYKEGGQLTPIRFGNNSSKHVGDNKSECQVTPVTSSSNRLTSKLKIKAMERHLTSNNFSIQPQIKKNTTLEAQLAAQIKRLNEKYTRLEKLKQEEVYTRKHNMLELQKTTAKWMVGFKEVTLALHSELQSRGRSCTVLDILEEHNIPPERVGFSIENQEFD